MIFRRKARRTLVRGESAEPDGRHMTRAAFIQAAASGRSPGAAALLAELERGWVREDARLQDTQDGSERP
jgi:hypothetical protein